MNNQAEDIPTMEEACRAAYGTKYPYDTEKTLKQLKQEREAWLRVRRFAAAMANEHRNT